MIRKDYIEKYNIDVSKVKTLDDVESMILKPIKAAEPDLVPMLPQNATTTYTGSMSGMDQAGGDTFGVLMNRGQELKLANWYESSQYADLLKRFRSWYLAGYIMKDIATNKESVASLIKAQKGIAYINSTKPGVEIDESNNAGTQLVNLELLPPLATTSVPQRVQWAIPAQAKTPEKSMQFLNLLYTDSAIINLLDWGIEGKHYVKNSDGSIDYPSGVDAKTSGYNLNMGWVFGNQFLSYTWKGAPLDLWKQVDMFNRDATKSKALGFTFDSSNVKTEKAALQSVLDQYKTGLEFGVLDPDKTLPEFISKLKAAGIDKYIQEKQRQLDEWAKNNNVK
jgi:putative aldouronate transport system substrate-binding protein